MIGAFALKAYGYLRATQDIDFIVRRESQPEIVVYLESIGFETAYRSAGYSNHVHSLTGLGRIDFVYVKGKTAEEIFRNISKLLTLGDIRLLVVSPEHLVALKLFAVKNGPDRADLEVADIKFLNRLPGIDKEKVRSYFEKFNQMEKYYEITWKEPNTL